MGWGHLGHWGEWGPGWAWMFVSHLLWWVVLGVAIVLLLRRVWRPGPQPPVGPARDPALELLRERFARGEIDEQQYIERKRVLGA